MWHNTYVDPVGLLLSALSPVSTNRDQWSDRVIVFFVLLCTRADLLHHKAHAQCSQSCRACKGNGLSVSLTLIILFLKNRTCNYGKLNYFMGRRAYEEGRPALYPEIDFCKFPQGICSSDDTYSGELQWMVGFFEWADRIQTYDVNGWNYIKQLKAFTDGGYKDFSFVDAVSGIVNLGCHDPPCPGFSTAVDPHNKRERNDTFQRLLNELQVARNFRPPPKPTPMPSPVPTELPTVGVPTTGFPTALDPPTERPTITASPTALQGRPPQEAVRAVQEALSQNRARFADLVLRSRHPSGELWPSYLYTFADFQEAIEKMTGGDGGVGPGEKNFFYIGDGYSAKTAEYGLVNIAAFVAQGVVQSIYYDA